MGLSWGLLSEQTGHRQLRSIRVITTYTLCYFLAEQAQALAQWDLMAQPGQEMVPIPGISSETPKSYRKDREKSGPFTWERHWLRKRLEKEVPFPLSRIETTPILWLCYPLGYLRSETGFFLKRLSCVKNSTRLLQVLPRVESQVYHLWSVLSWTNYLTCESVS